MSNENPQVATPVVRLSYLLELKTAANYEDMFAQLVTLAPETKQWVEEEIRWAKSTLKKSNRITWWLRWVRLALVAGALNLAAQNKAEQNKEALEALLKKAARDAQTQPGAAPAYVTLRTTHRTLEHFYSLPVVGIQNLEPGYKTPAELVDEFTAIEQAWIEQSKGTLIPKSQDTKFIDFGNGWAWWLLPRAACSDEAKVMGHCGNSPQSGRTDRTILSLRQVRKIGDQERWEPHLTFILHTDGDDDERGTLGEMKGKGNAKPVKRYHPYIMRLLEDPRIEGIDGGGYLRENNFSFKDLTDEEQEQVRAANPDAYFSIEDLLTKKNIDLTRVAAKLGISRAREMELKGQPGILIQEWTDPEAVVVDHGEESLKEMQGCVDGSMEFLAKHLLEDIEPSPAVFAAIARQINEEFDADLDTDPRSPQVVDAVLAHVADMDDGGESTLRTVLEEAYLEGNGWTDPVTTFKEAIKAYVKDGLDFSDDTPGELHVTEEDRVLHWVSASDLLDLATHHADEDEQEFYWYSFQVYGPNVDDGLRDPSAAEDVLIDKLRVTNLSGRKLEQRGQERLFKRPETDEEAQRDGIKTSYLLEPKTAASYDDMFKPLLDLTPAYEASVNQGIQWAKQALKKSNRITWYLRWFRVSVLNAALSTRSSDADAQQTAQLQQMRDKAVRELASKTGLSEDEVRREATDLDANDQWLEHIFSLPFDAVQTYEPRYKAPKQVRSELEPIEEAFKTQAKNTIKPLEGDTVFIQCDANWAWWLLPRAACDAESRAMGHCGNAPERNRTDRNILSLRQKKQVGKETLWEPHLTFILHVIGQPGTGTLGEMKGRGNAKPSPKYHPQIVTLLCDHRIIGIDGGGYLAGNNFSLDDLSPEQLAVVQEKNPDATLDIKQFLEEHRGDSIYDQRIAERLGLKANDTCDDGFVYRRWATLDEFVQDCGVTEVKTLYAYITTGLMQLFVDDMLSQFEDDKAPFWRGLAIALNIEHVGNGLGSDKETWINPDSPELPGEIQKVLAKLEIPNENSYLRQHLENAFNQATLGSAPLSGQEEWGPGAMFNAAWDSALVDDPTELEYHKKGVVQYVDFDHAEELASESRPPWGFGRPVLAVDLDVDYEVAWEALNDAFNPDNLKAKLREQVGQERLFKRPETDEEAQRDGIKTSYLLEPKTAASYDDMFKPLLALLPEAEPEVKAAIQWAKTTLRKADRITWYLRWARMEILLGYIHTPNPEQVVEYYQKLLREAMNKSGKSADDINLDLRHMQTSRTFFAHAYAMHLDAIENYIPKFELPSTLEDTFDEFERQAREAAKDDDKLLSPEDEDEIWLDLGKGWAWWFLDRDSCDAEGAAMGHCGNGSGKYTDRILSLRQHKKVAGEDYWEPHCTFILKPNGALGEMKGRNNEKPVERYHNAIVALLSDHRITMVLGGGYLPENNFSLSDLSSADREKVRKANPGLATTLYAAYKKHGIGAVEEAVEDSTEDLEYVEDIGFVYETWRDKNAMILDIGFEGRDLTTDVIETIFEDIEDGDPCLPNIVQSFLNEFPGKRTEIEQYDPNSAEAVMELIWNLSQSYGTESDTIERIVEDVVFCDAAVESMFYAWRSNHGSLESLTKAETGDAWYLYADTHDLLEALDEGHSAKVEWPTLNPEEMDEDTPVDFTGLLDALFTNPLPRPRGHNEVRLYPEPKSDAEAQRNGIRISHLLRAKAPRKTAASDEVERDAALRHEDEHAFVNHHYTGHINSESYDDKALDWQQLKSYPKLLKRVALKDGTEVDLRQSDEKLRYVKRDENGWTVRYEQGHPAHLSDEEIEAEGLPVYETAIMAFTDAGECVGMASDEFGADGVWVRSTFQGKGLGTILLTELRRQFRNVRRMGQMTPAGVALAQSYYRQMTGRKPTPKPVDPQLILSRFMGHVQWDKATPEQTAALREFYSRVEETDHDEPGKLFEEVLGWAKANWATPVLGDWSKRYMREGEMAKDGGYLRKQAGTKLTKDLLSQIAEQVRADLLPDRDAQNGDCDPISEAIVARLEALGIDAYVVSDSFLGLPHSWVQAGALWVDATRDQFAYEDVDDPDQYFDTPVVIGRGQMTKQAGKTAFVSPVSGELALTIENAARPKVTISLDLGIPNFTRFSIAVPVENLSNIEIDQFCRQAFEALLQNVTAFLISMKYNEDLIADVLANAEAAFMALGADDASDAGMPDRDASLRLYESSFELPEDFVMETRAKVVTASVVRRTPEIHKIELTPLDALATDETPARTIEFYLDQATKTTPRAFAVSVIEQTPSNKPARDWESRLLPKANKHRTAASAWYTPERVKYLVDWVTGVRDENSGYPRMGLRFTEYPYAVGETTRNSYHPVDHANTWSDDEPEYEEDIELDGTCCFDLGAGELGDIHNAIAAARSYGFGPSAAQHYVSVIGGSSSNDGLGVDGVDYGLAEQGAVCISDAKVLGTIDLRSNAG